ncbi:MAG TPA: hypothetical protein VF814_04700 [Casimicrobiaceae bacterium]
MKRIYATERERLDAKRQRNVSRYHRDNPGAGREKHACSVCGVAGHNKLTCPDPRARRQPIADQLTCADPGVRERMKCWFVRVRIELRGGRWRWVSSLMMSYSDAGKLLELHTRSGRAAELVCDEEHRAKLTRARELLEARERRVERSRQDARQLALWEIG